MCGSLKNSTHALVLPLKTHVVIERIPSDIENQPELFQLGDNRKQRRLSKSLRPQDLAGFENEEDLQDAADLEEEEDNKSDLDDHSDEEETVSKKG